MAKFILIGTSEAINIGAIQTMRIYATICGTTLEPELLVKLNIQLTSGKVLDRALYRTKNKDYINKVSWDYVEATGEVDILNKRLADLFRKGPFDGTLDFTDGAMQTFLEKLLKEYRYELILNEFTAKTKEPGQVDIYDKEQKCTISIKLDWDIHLTEKQARYIAACNKYAVEPLTVLPMDWGKNEPVIHKQDISQRQAEAFYNE